MKKFRSYIKKLRRIFLVWNATFYLLSPTEYWGKVHFLICHKIFWAYLRQGLFRKEFSISFPKLPTFPMLYQKHPYLYLFYRTSTVIFPYDDLVEEILEKCGFVLMETPYLENNFCYSFR